MTSKATFRQKGGTLMGLVIGLLIGLALALGVALYVSKVPVPFVDKLPQRSPEQDAAEALRNRNWDPNAPLNGKSPPPPNRAASAAADPADASAAGSGARDPSATGGKTTDPKLEVTGLFIQAGAFSRLEEAEQQRAKLAMLGYAARISEREQSGKMVYRVRLGPYETREETTSPVERLQAAGLEVSLVRVERNPAP